MDSLKNAEITGTYRTVEGATELLQKSMIGYGRGWSNPQGKYSTPGLQRSTCCQVSVIWEAMFPPRPNDYISRLLLEIGVGVTVLHFIKRKGDSFFPTSFLHPTAWIMDVTAGALAAFCFLKMTTKPKRWLWNELASICISDNFMEPPYLSQATYFQTSLKREKNKWSYLSPYHLKMFSYTQSTLILTRTLANWSTPSPALLYPYLRSCHCSNREYSLPPCLYWLKSCPSFGGWIKFYLPPEISLLLPPWIRALSACLPLGIWPALPSRRVIHPSIVISWLLDQARDHQGKAHAFQILVFPGLERNWIQDHNEYPHTKPPSPLPTRGR